MSDSYLSDPPDAYRSTRNPATTRVTAALATRVTRGDAVQLSAPLGAMPASTDLATALRVAATRLGHRPAVTVLRHDRRDEQGFASLAQWASKGAHLLELEAELRPGDRLLAAMPAGWPAAAVCFAAWWVGVTIVVAGPAEVAVVHESRDMPADVAEVYAMGDAIDATPLTSTDAEAWSLAVQSFPDQPPKSRAGPDMVAAELDGTRWTQAQLLEMAGRWGYEGALGLLVDAPSEVWIPALVRPLVVGRATVVIAGVPRETAEAEGVSVWAAVT